MLLSLLLLAPAASQAAEPTLLVGTTPGATASSAAPGARLAPGIRAVRGGAATARRLRRLPGVRWVEPNRRFTASSVAAPTDPLFGAVSGRSGARASRARGATATGGDVTVAVVDSGIDLSNPDLGENLWANPGEIAGNGVDDDANGFVDDVHGADTVSHDGDPADGLGHGTAVASMIGARGNNGLGITGVDWHVRLMPVKVLHDRGWGTTVTLIERPPLRARERRARHQPERERHRPSQALDEAIRAGRGAGRARRDLGRERRPGS